jgi:KilA-N domain
MPVEPESERTCEWCGLVLCRKYGVKRHQKICPNKPTDDEKDDTKGFLFEKGRLTFNGIIIPCRKSDGFVCLTKLAAAGEHRLDNYFQSKSTQTFLTALRKLPIFQEESKLVVTEEGRYGGSWGHRYIAYNYAQYISGEFAACVCVWLDEMFQTGKGTPKEESDVIELETQWKDKFLELEAKHDALYNPQVPETIPDFPSGFYIYLIEDPRDIFHEITYGKTKDMVDRAVRYRAQFKCVNPVIHKTWRFDTQEEVNDVENILHIGFRKYRNPSNSEWLTDIDIKKAITIVESAINMYKIQSNDS